MRVLFRDAFAAFRYIHTAYVDRIGDFRVTGQRVEEHRIGGHVSGHLDVLRPAVAFR